jgi:hypothetical protein
MRRSKNSYNGIKNIFIFSVMLFGAYYYFNWNNGYGFQQHRSRALSFLKVGDGVVVHEIGNNIHIRKYKGSPSVVTEIGEDFVLVKTSSLERVYPIYNISKIELDILSVAP